MGKDLCSKCSAMCCKYFALEIDTPTTAREFDDIRWHLCHENVFVFVEKRKWFLGVRSRCTKLLADNRCAIYEKRPRVCRGYSTHRCDYHGEAEAHDRLFTTPEDLERYAAERLRRRRQRAKGPRGPRRRRAA